MTVTVEIPESNVALLLNAEILERLRNLEGLTMSNQEKLNAIAVALDAAATGLAADIAALKAAVAAGEKLDFSDLDAKVAALSALDADNPPAPVAP